MIVTRNDVDRVPTRNLRVPLGDFVTLWVAADGRNQELTGHGAGDWYTAGVVVTCLWLANAVQVPSSGRQHPARSPCTDRQISADPETIEAEYQATELMTVRQPRLIEQRPGWCEGIRATLRRAWRNEGPPPLDENGEPTACSAPRT